MTTRNDIDLSIVVPLYNEEESLTHLVEAISTAMAPQKIRWELVCVDDGSKDRTAQMLQEATKTCPELHPLYLRRNYGQTAAMQAGFDHARGAVIAAIDGDLQNDPKDIAMMMEKMKETGAEVVAGWRKNRKDKFVRSFLSRRANRLISRVTGVELHDYGCTLKIFKREVLENVRLYGEMHRFIPALVSQYGAKIVEVPVNHRPREFGSSKYGLDRTFRVILDLLLVKFLLKYLHRPIHAFGMAGLVSGGIGTLICLYLTVLKIFGENIGDRPLLLLGALLILVGVQLFGMGILGEVLVRIYHEPDGRKQYFLREGPRP